MYRPNYDFKQPKPSNLKTKIFNLIEHQQTDELIEFFQQHKEQVTSYIAQNHWTVGMYAVRYGNHKLIRFLHQEGLLTEHPQSTYSLIHAACFNNDVETLKVLVDELGKDPNAFVQFQADNSPLKYAYKNDLSKTIEFLCSRGAYYHYENVTNNMTKEPNEMKYKTITDKEDIQNQQILVIKGNRAIEPKDKTTPFVRFTRFRNILFLKHIIDNTQTDIEQENKLDDLKGFFEDEIIFEQLVEMIAPKA